MISESGRPYWNLIHTYRANPDAQKLILQGEALYVLKDASCEATRKRIAAFISAECARHGIADKTAAFMAP